MSFNVWLTKHYIYFDPKEPSKTYGWHYSSSGGSEDVLPFTERKQILAYTKAIRRVLEPRGVDKHYAINVAALIVGMKLSNDYTETCEADLTAFFEEEGYSELFQQVLISLFSDCCTHAQLEHYDLIEDAVEKLMLEHPLESRAVNEAQTTVVRRPVP